MSAFFDLPHRSIVYGHFTIAAHYELVLDNLMDLSHAPFLHAGSLSNGEEDLRALKVETMQDGDTVTANHRLDATEPTPQFRPFWRSTSQVGDLRANMRWSPPCTLALDVGMSERGRPVDEGPNLHMVHLLTPAAAGETWYFWAAARNYEVGNEKVSSVVHAAIHDAFTLEDEPMIKAVQERMGTHDLFSLNPVLLRGDKASVLVRRILEKRRSLEARPLEAR